LQSSRGLRHIAAAILQLAGALGVLTWRVGLFAGISAKPNQIHKWSQRTRRENGRIISLLQDLRLVQTPQHHAIHHADPKNVHYCPVTNFLNPILDRARFWDALEWLLARTVRLHRRPGASLSGCGSSPEWIAQLRAVPPLRRSCGGAAVYR